MNLIPASLQMLGYTGLLAHEEARQFLELWDGEYAVLDDGKPFAILAVKPHPEKPQYGWGNVWVVPERRGRWLSDAAREMVKSFALMRYHTVLAGTDNPRCSRFLRQQGFKLYCQDAGVSYYSITREAA